MNLSGWMEWIKDLGIIGASIAFIVLTVFYFRIGWLVKWIDKIPAIKKYIWLINELGKDRYNAVVAFVVYIIVALSCFCYAIFFIVSAFLVLK
jgi:hypothetical protein